MSIFSLKNNTNTISSNKSVGLQFCGSRRSNSLVKKNIMPWLRANKEKTHINYFFLAVLLFLILYPNPIKLKYKQKFTPTLDCEIAECTSSVNLIYTISLFLKWQLKNK